MARGRISPLVGLLSLVAVSPSFSGEPAPPEELAQLDVMLGNWDSSGTWRLSRDSAPVRWTAVSTVEKILGGHFIQETTRIEPGTEGSAPVVMRSVVGWDAASKRFRQFAVSNMGSGGVTTLYVAEKGKFVTTYVRSEMGRPMVEVGVSEYSQDGGSFRMESSVGGGQFFVSLEGTMKRGGKGCPADAIVSEPLAPPPAELAPIAKLVGDWSYKARISPMRGLPMMETSGRETVTRIAGGHAYHGVITSDPMPEAPEGYRGEFYLFWDAEQRAYSSLDVDSFGQFSVSTGYKEGENRLVYGMAGSVYGEPSVSRAILGWNDDVSVMEVTAHRMAGAADPEKSFEGRFVRRKD
jgi:hypothetical protein